MSPTESAVLQRIERKIDALDKKFDTQNIKLARHDERLKAVEREQAGMKSKLWAVLVLVIGGALTGFYNLLSGKSGA